jgi:hypothetical protein
MTEGAVQKKYFVKQVCCNPQEVTHEEYVRLANQQFMAKDAEIFERVLESATHEAPACGTTHAFWTE